MKLSEMMAEMQNNRAAFLNEWAFIKYDGRCKNCGRYRRYLCENGNHLCDKCEWCEELKQYVNLEVD